MYIELFIDYYICKQKSSFVTISQYSNEHGHIKFLYVILYNYDLKYSYLFSDSEYICIYPYMNDASVLAMRIRLFE